MTAPWLMRAQPEASAASPAWKMRLSTSSAQYVPLPIEQVRERIAKLGFEAIDIWGPLFKCTHLDDIAAGAGAKGLKELLAKHKLKLFAFSLYRGDYPKYMELLGAAGGGRRGGHPRQREAVQAGGVDGDDERVSGEVEAICRPG